MDIYRALLSLRPGAKWHLDGNDYSNIQWLELSEVLGGQSQPTKEEVITEIERLQAEYESKEYQRLRQAEYPSFADQFDILYHEGYDAWKEKINMIKTTYPKPIQESLQEENVDDNVSSDTTYIVLSPPIEQEEQIIESFPADSNVESES